MQPRRPRSRVRLVAARALLPLFAGVVLAAAAGADPPRVAVAVDSTSVTLGDPILLRVTVERDALARTLFPDIVDDLVEPLVVRSAEVPVSSALTGGRQRDERTYVLSAFTLDAAVIPSLPVAVVAAAGDTVRLATAPIPIRVAPVRKQGEGNRLRDIKPPVLIPGGIPLWLAGGLAAAAAALIAWGASRWLRRQRPVPPPVVASALPVDYEREFTCIADLGLLERGALKPYYTRLSDVMRRFLEDRLALEALERTTAEIADGLAGRRVPGAPLAARVVRFLESADLVKFAKASPPEREARSAPEEGRQIVVEMDRQLAEAREAVAAARQADLVPTQAEVDSATGGG